MKKWIRGSYTVEAALLLPVILFVIVSFIYLSFYLHDKYRIEEVLNIASLKAIAYNQTETNMVTGQVDYESYLNQGIFYRFESRENKEKEVFHYLHTYLNERLFLTKVNKIEVKISHVDIEIRVIANVDVPTFGEIYSDDYRINFYISEENIMSAREFVRMFDTLGGVAEKVPGADKAIDMLKKLIQ